MHGWDLLCEFIPDKPFLRALAADVLDCSNTLAEVLAQDCSNTSLREVLEQDCSNTSLKRVLEQGVRISKGVLAKLF